MFLFSTLKKFEPHTRYLAMFRFPAAKGTLLGFSDEIVLDHWDVDNLLRSGWKKL